MKNTLLRWVAVFAALFIFVTYSNAQFDITKADVVLPTGSALTNADWNKTYNPGMPGEVLVSSGGAEVQSKTSCAKGAKANSLALSSDSYLVEMSVPALSTAVIKYMMLDIVGNSETISGNHQVWGSTSSTFDVTKAYKIAEFPVVGYGALCSDAHQELTFPAGLKIKSIRIYGKKAKDVADNGDGTYNIGGGSDDIGSGQSLNIFSTYLWLEKGPQMFNYNIFGVDADVIDHTAGTVHVTVPFATNLAVSELPVITLSPGASYDGASVFNDLTPVTFSTTPNPVYLLTDGTDTKTYTVTVTKAPASKICNIKSFSIPNQVGTSQFIPAAGTAKDSIIVTMPFSTPSFSALVPTYILSDSLSTCLPDSLVAQDFTTSVSYTVTAEDVTVTKEYVVRVKKAPADKKCAIDSLKGFAAKEQITYNPSTSTYNVVVPQSSNLSSLSPQIFFSPLSSNTGIPIDYTTPQTITVTAEDGVTKKNYTISVTKDNTPPSLLLSKPADGAIDYSLAGLMSLKYSEPIVLGTQTLSISGGGVLGTVSITDSVAKFSFSNLTKLTTYTVNIPAGMFEDELGNACAASSFSFTTANDVFLKVDSVYASHMTAESFDLPAFITGSNFTTVKYDPTADVKATTTTQYGAYVIPPGEKLIIKAEQVGSFLASIYAKGGNRSYTISSNTDPLVSSGNLVNYDNNGDTISWIPTSVITTNPTEIYITNTSTVGDIYVPYIYINALGATVMDEQSVNCTSVAP